MWLLTALIACNFSYFFIYAGFQINQKYIAENLCINKSRPWMHCNGQCYLMKKMRQAQDNEKKQAARDNLSRLEISFFQQPSDLIFLPPAILERNKSAFPLYTYQYTSSYITTIFRPPKQVA